MLDFMHLSVMEVAEIVKPVDLEMSIHMVYMN